MGDYSHRVVSHFFVILANFIKIFGQRQLKNWFEFLYKYERNMKNFTRKDENFMYTPNTTYYQQAYQASNPPRTQVPQQPPVVQQSSPFLKGRLVSSIEEARAQTIDFDGSVFYFPDLANKKIYTKQINLDGTSSLNMYELKEIPQPMMVTQGQEYITREEFEAAIASLKEKMAPTQVTSSPEPVQAPSSIF